MTVQREIRQPSAGGTSPDWTAALPPLWTIRRLKFVADVRLSNVDKKTVDGERPVRLCNYVDVYKNDFITPNMDFMEATATERQVAEFTLHEGDVLITKDSEEWSDIAVPAFVCPGVEGVVCGYHLALLRPKPGKIDGRYLFRALAAEGIADHFRMSANGITRYGLSNYDIGTALIPVPPPDEQRAIADFLDRKIAIIDAVVAKKQRMIEVLGERRKSVIFEAVSGKDRQGGRVATSSPWMRLAPVDWTPMQLKQAFRSMNYGISDSLLPDGKYKVLRMGDIKDEKVSTENPGYVNEVDPSLLLDRNDLLFNRTNSLEQIGKVGMFEGSRSEGVTFASYLVRLRTNSLALPKFMNYLLNTEPFLAYVRGLALPSINQANLNPTRYGAVKVYLPPVAEQEQIVELLDKECGRIETIIEKNRAHVERLHEYRRAIVAAAVTGKLHVPVALAGVDIEQFAEDADEHVDGTTDVTRSCSKPKANPYFRRAVLAAEIVHRLHGDPTFGRVKFQKVLYLAEHHLRLPDVQSQYKRQVAGPFDNRLMRSVEGQLERSKWYKAVHENGRTVYVPMSEAGGHKKYWPRYWADYQQQFDWLIELLQPLTTQWCEIIATLYAAWNDFLIGNEPADDDQIVHEVLTNWNPSKERIDEKTWKAALTRMKVRGLVPHGHGLATNTSTADRRGK